MGRLICEHQDWQGTERVRTTYNGQIEGTFTSLPFGDGYGATGSDWDPYHFAGLDRDYSSATDHARFRQYGEAAGSWMSPDPYSGSYDFTNPQSLNWYAYVLNNPLGFTDPLGLYQISCPPGTSPNTLCVEGSTGSEGDDGAGGGGGEGGDPLIKKDPAGGGVGAAGLAITRQLDPNNQECKALAAKIANLVADIQSSTQDLASNPKGLPELPPFPGAPRRLSVQGHRENLNDKIQRLARRAHEYNQKCGGGDPFGRGTSATNPSSAPSKLVSWDSSRGDCVGGVVVVGGIVIMCPECLAAAPVFAF